MFLTHHSIRLACEIAEKHVSSWRTHCLGIKEQMTELVLELGGSVIGENTSPFVINFYIPGVNSEATIDMLKDTVAISNGSACTSTSYKPSHVLSAMDLSDDTITGSMRVSWSHMTNGIPFESLKSRLLKLL